MIAGSCSHAQELPAHRSAEGKKEEEAQEVVFWYSLPQTEEVSSHRASKSRGPPFEPLADFFGIWHEYKRGDKETPSLGPFGEAPICNTPLL